MADEPEQDVVARLHHVRGLAWEWREDRVAGRTGSDAGVVAQEVEKVFPELVTTDEHGVRMVNYAGLVGVLIEAVKELDARVRDLEGRSRT